MPALIKITPNSPFRYLLVGGTAFAVEYLLFFSLYSLLDLQLLLANSLSFLGGLVLSFSLQRSWTFKKQHFHKTARRQFFLYGALALCNLLIINVLLGYLTRGGLDPLIGKIVVMLAIVCWNFLLMRGMIFKEIEDKQQR